LLAALNQRAELEVRPRRQGLLDERESVELRVHAGATRDLLLGFLGTVSASGLKRFDLRGATTVAE